MVLDGSRANSAAIPSSSLASCDASSGLVAACEDVADTASGVFCRNTLQLRVRKKKPFTLSERHGMRSDGFQTVKSRARTADQVMFDREDDFRDDFQVAFQQKVVNANDRPGKRVLNGSEKGVGRAFRDRAKRGIKRCTWNGGDRFAQKLDRRGFAEGTVLALKGHSRARVLGTGHGTDS